MNEKKKNVMESILNDKDESLSNKNQELDCLIYRNDAAMQKEGAVSPTEESWKIVKENVSIEIWEGPAKINVRVSPGIGLNIPIKKIASLVVDAILKELKKEG